MRSSTTTPSPYIIRLRIDVAMVAWLSTGWHMRRPATIVYIERKKQHVSHLRSSSEKSDVISRKGGADRLLQELRHIIKNCDIFRRPG